MAASEKSASAGASKGAVKNTKASAKVRAAQQQKRQRMQWSIGIIALVIVGIVVLVLAKSSKSDSTATPSSSAKPAPASVVKNLASVPLTAIAAAAKAGTPQNALKPVPDGKLRTVNGRPEVLYMGGEFCPFCAGERWAMVVALSKFGTFKDLQVIHSGESDVPTLTFEGSSFTSKYVTFTPKEIRGNKKDSSGNWVVLDKATDEQMSLLTNLGGGSFPFIDFGGKFYQSGGSVDASALVGKSQTDIASMLAASTTSTTSASSLEGTVNQTAGEFIRTICGLTGDQPAKVCKAFPAT